MKLRDLLKTVIESDADDWNRIGCWGGYTGPAYRDRFGVVTGGGEAWSLEIDSHATVAAYMPDLSITMAWGFPHNNDFHDDWLKRFADSKAHSEFFDIFYNNALVFRDIFVSVDGGRAYLPAPDPATMSVPTDYVRMIELIDNLSRGRGDYSDYLRRAGMSLSNEPWPDCVHGRQ
jgi:hypothetical protein